MSSYLFNPMLLAFCSFNFSLQLSRYFISISFKQDLFLRSPYINQHISTCVKFFFILFDPHIVINSEFDFRSTKIGSNCLFRNRRRNNRIIEFISLTICFRAYKRIIVSCVYPSTVDYNREQRVLVISSTSLVDELIQINFREELKLVVYFSHISILSIILKPF